MAKRGPMTVEFYTVKGLVEQLDECQLLDDVIKAIPIARVKKVLEPYKVSIEKEKQHG